MTDLGPIASVSREYLLITVEGHDDNGVVDPTGFTPSVAFTAVDVAPVGGTTWYTASWVTVVQAYIPNIYKIKVLVGPSGGVVTLSPGSYDVWIRVVATFESPIKKVGSLLVV